MSMDMSTAAAVRAQPALRAQVMPTRPVAANGSSKPADGPETALVPKVEIQNLSFFYGSSKR